VEFHGRYWDIPPMDPEPRPVQARLPILIGGHSQPAIDRAARLGDGWITANVTPRRLEEMLPAFDEALARNGRTRDDALLYSETMPSAVPLDDIRRYEDLGVDSLHIRMRTFEELTRVIDEVLPALR